MMKNWKKKDKKMKKKFLKKKNEENCNFPKNEKMQFESIFYHFLSFFNHFFYHVSSFLLPVVKKKSKKWKIAIFLGFLSFF